MEREAKEKIYLEFFNILKYALKTPTLEKIAKGDITQQEIASFRWKNKNSEQISWGKFSEEKKLSADDIYQHCTKLKWDAIYNSATPLFKSYLDEAKSGKSLDLHLALSVFQPLSQEYFLILTSKKNASEVKAFLKDVSFREDPNYKGCYELFLVTMLLYITSVTDEILKERVEAEQKEKEVLIDTTLREVESENPTVKDPEDIFSKLVEKILSDSKLKGHLKELLSIEVEQAKTSLEVTMTEKKEELSSHQQTLSVKLNENQTHIAIAQKDLTQEIELQKNQILSVSDDQKQGLSNHRNILEKELQNQQQQILQEQQNKTSEFVQKIGESEHFFAEIKKEQEKLSGISSQFEELEKRMDGKIHSISEKQSELTHLLTLQNNKIEKVNRDLEEQSKVIQDTESRLHRVLEEQLQQSKTDLQKSLRQTKDLVNQELAENKQSLEQLTQSLNRRTAELSKLLATEIQQIKSSIQMEVTTVQKSLHSFNGQLNAFSERLESHKAGLDQTLEAYSEQQVEKTTEIESSIASLKEELKILSEQLEKVSKNSYANGIGRLKPKAESSFDLVKRGVSESKQVSRKNYQSILYAQPTGDGSFARITDSKNSPTQLYKIGIIDQNTAEFEFIPQGEIVKKIQSNSMANAPYINFVNFTGNSFELISMGTLKREGSNWCVKEKIKVKRY